MNWVLILVAAIAAICIGLGWHAGFVKSVFHLCSFIVALIIASMVGPVVSNVLVEQEAVMNPVADHVYDALKLEELGNMESAAKSDIQKLELPDAIKKQLEKHNTKKNYEKVGAEAAGEYISKTIAVIIIRCAVYVVVFLCALIALIIVSNVLNFVSKLPVLNSVNRIAGAGIGAVEAVVIIALVLALFTALSNTDLGKSAMEMIADNAFLSFIYSHNPVNAFALDISGLFK